jgi:hypothetical protein
MQGNMLHWENLSRGVKTKARFENVIFRAQTLVKGKVENTGRKNIARFYTGFWANFG